MMAKRNVMLATPAYDGRVDVGYTHSLLSSVALCQKNGIGLHPIWWPGEALIQHARNMLVQMAIETGVDILFVDTDESWQPKDLLRILQHPVHVVGAAVRKKDSQESYNIYSKQCPPPRDPATGLLKVDGLGTGFLKVSIDALRDVYGLALPYAKSGQKCRMVFDVVVRDGELFGEDTFFCASLRGLGYDIHVDTAADIVHNGNFKYTGSLDAYLKRL